MQNRLPLLPPLLNIGVNNTEPQNEADRISDEIQCITKIVLNDDDESKKNLRVTVDRIHVYGAVLFSCKYHAKKVPTLQNVFIQKLANGRLYTEANVSDATLAMGWIAGHDMDVMDKEILKQDVALLWAYWGIIQAGEKYEKIARLCPIFVEIFLQFFGSDNKHFKDLHTKDADWLHLPGMINAIPSTPDRFAIDTSTWKETYMKKLEDDISKANVALNSLSRCSSLVCDTKQLQENKEKLQKLLQRINADSQEHEFLLHMLHDLYDDKVKNLYKIVQGYSWAQMFQMVLTIDERDRPITR